MESTKQELLAEIAELKWRLDEAEKENERLASLPAMNPNPVLEISLAGSITFANPAAREIVKSLTPPARLLDFLPPDWKNIKVRGNYQEDKIFYREVRLRERIYAESISFIEPYQVWRLYAIDITERHWADEALREAHSHIISEKNRLEAVLEALPAGVAILDEKGGIIQANVAYKELWGGPRPLIRDANDYAAYKAWWLDTGRPVHPEEWACFQVFQQGKAIIGQMLEIENFAGERRCVINSGAPIRDADGKNIGCAIAIVDITDLRRAEAALRQSEERLRLATRAGKIGLFEWNTTQDTIYWSPEMCELLGQEPHTQGTYDRFVHCLHPDDREWISHVTADFLERAKRQESIQDRQDEFRVVHKDGAIHWLDQRAVFEYQGGNLVLRGAVQDITARQAAEEILRRSHEELEQQVAARTGELSRIVEKLLKEIVQRQRAEQALKESEARLRLLAGQLINAQEMERKRLAAELHDQLGHSLLIMKLSLGSIMRNLPPTQSDFKQLIQEQLDYLDNLIDQARRLYYNLSPGELEDLGLNTALENLVEEFCDNYPDITYDVTLPELAGLFDLPIQITIYRLMEEALINVGKHAGAMKIKVWGRLDNQQFRLCLEDDGQGFDVSEVERILKKGIGLAAMQERLKAINGSLEIDSQQGQGTRVTFIIPYQNYPPVGLPCLVHAPEPGWQRESSGRTAGRQRESSGK